MDWPSWKRLRVMTRDSPRATEAVPLPRARGEAGRRRPPRIREAADKDGGAGSGVQSVGVGGRRPRDPAGGDILAEGGDSPTEAEARRGWGGAARACSSFRCSLKDGHCGLRLLLNRARAVPSPGGGHPTGSADQAKRLWLGFPVFSGIRCEFLVYSLVRQPHVRSDVREPTACHSE